MRIINDERNELKLRNAFKSTTLEFYNIIHFLSTHYCDLIDSRTNNAYFSDYMSHNSEVNHANMITYSIKPSLTEQCIIPSQIANIPYLKKNHHTLYSDECCNFNSFYGINNDPNELSYHWYNIFIVKPKFNFNKIFVFEC